jgi:hypothetical protein
VRVPIRIVVGALGLLAAVVLMSTFNADVPSGLIERGSVYSIVLWELLVAVALLRSPVAGTPAVLQGLSAEARSTRAL